MKSAAFYKSFITEDIYLTNKMARLASIPISVEKESKSDLQEVKEEEKTTVSLQQETPTPITPEKVDQEPKISGNANSQLLIVLNKAEAQGEIRDLLIKILEQTRTRPSAAAYFYMDEEGAERTTLEELALYSSSNVILAFGRQEPGRNWNEHFELSGKKILLAPGLKALNDSRNFKLGLWAMMKNIF